MRFISAHARLLLSISVGVATFIFLSTLVVDINARIALSWVACALFYIGYVFYTMCNVTKGQLSKKAGNADISNKLMLVMMITAAFLSLYLALALMSEAKIQQGLGHAPNIIIALCTIIASWTMVQVMFAVHYTHHYYYHDKHSKKDMDGPHGGLKFPNADQDETPDFWDFLYFSLVLGMTFQVSDVQITRKHMRHLALWHGVVAFFFNTFILASMVNMAASLFS